MGVDMVRRRGHHARGYKSRHGLVGGAMVSGRGLIEGRSVNRECGHEGGAMGMGVSMRGHIYSYGWA